MTGQLVKVIFPLDPADWHGYQSETLWANVISIGECSLLGELENSPFYAKGVSYGDVILAERASDGEFLFSTVKCSSGHSTYRLLVDNGRSELFQGIWSRLEELGCTYESATFRDKRLYSVDVPPSSDIYKVYSALKDGESSGCLIFEEGHVGKVISARH